MDNELFSKKFRIAIQLSTDRGAKQIFAFHIAIQQGHLIYETSGESVRIAIQPGRPPFIVANSLRVRFFIFTRIFPNKCTFPEFSDSFRIPCP